MLAQSNSKHKFLIVSEYGELLDLALHLQNVEKQEVLLHLPDKEYSKIGEGLVDKTDDSWIHMGKGYTWVFDGCSRGKRIDWLRSKGELVVGGTEKTDKLENDRQIGQALFKAAGFKQPKSQNFKDFESAIQYVNKSKNRLILKQNGSAPKSLNHMGKFDDGTDMLFHLEQLKKSWNEAAYGEVDFDLMEVVEGLEVAASAFFNGKEFLKNADGKVVGFLNFEEKKVLVGGLGSTCGEMGTTFVGVTEDNEMFKEIMMKPKIIEVLQQLDYHGVFDINCIKTKEGIVALEPTCRFGVPATSYEFMEGLLTPAADVLQAMAEGTSIPVEVHQGIGMVMVITSKPFPVEAEMEENETSLGQRLWILKDGEPVKDFTDEQRKHIHLENFQKKDEYYCVATKNGYLLTVTGKGISINGVRESLIQYIKDNLFITDMGYRTDIGQRVEDSAGKNQNKLDEITNIKKALRAEIYGDDE